MHLLTMIIRVTLQQFKEKAIYSFTNISKPVLIELLTFQNACKLRSILTYIFTIELVIEQFASNCIQ